MAEANQFNAYIEAVASKPFKYGYREGLLQGNASLKFEKGRMVMRYKIPSVSSNLWYGDCVDDALLTYQSLVANGVGADKIEVQRLEETLGIL